MNRSVSVAVFTTVLCLGMMATAAFAKPVLHGAMDICQVEEGSQSWIDATGTEVCCNRTSNGDFYCVECDPPGSNNCEEWTETAKAGPDRVITILVNRALEERRAIRQELQSLPAKLRDLCTAAPPTNK